MAPSDGYVWFLPHWFTESWWNVEYFNEHNMETVTTCSSKQMLRAIRGHFIMSNAVFGDPEMQIVENMTVNEWQEAYLQSLSNLVSYNKTLLLFILLQIIVNYDGLWI